MRNRVGDRRTSAEVEKLTEGRHPIMATLLATQPRLFTGRDVGSHVWIGDCTPEATRDLCLEAVGTNVRHFQLSDKSQCPLNALLPTTLIFRRLIMTATTWTTHSTVATTLVNVAASVQRSRVSDCGGRVYICNDKLAVIITPFSNEAVRRPPIATKRIGWAAKANIKQWT